MTTFGSTACWAEGLALIVLTIAAHALGVVLLARGLQRAGNRGFYGRAFRHPVVLAVVVVGTIALLLGALHSLESAVWAAAYVWLDATDSFRDAMLYSVSSMATFAGSGLNLKPRWQVMGVLEAANGMLLFGISTAFLFAVLQEVMLIVSRFERSPHPLRKVIAEPR